MLNIAVVSTIARSPGDDLLKETPTRTSSAATRYGSIRRDASAVARATFSGPCVVIRTSVSTSTYAKSVTASKTISLRDSEYLAALGRLYPAQIEEARVLGMHLGGPFLSTERWSQSTW